MSNRHVTRRQMVVSAISDVDRLNPTLTLRSWPPAAFDNSIEMEVQMHKDQAIEAIRNGVEVIVTINDGQKSDQPPLEVVQS